MLSLVVALVTYVYLDAWPFATEVLEPFDPADDPVTWVRLGLLGFAGGVIPLIMPRPFRPTSVGVCALRTLHVQAILKSGFDRPHLHLKTPSVSCRVSHIHT